ncbi:MAG: type VI secretion system ImpA family N-terminal domain-containing protein [Chitinispirillales bacterium]|jgi:hypothetical protein|nr:type VI secretion system ImpA family N-terminal domain-containing protein [Chitinispirillales bacterium]
MSDFYSMITAPIAGENPFGEDVNYDVDYERLKGEMGKLGDIDINLVETLSVKILSEKSKDTRALAFLAYAVLRQSEIGRLADVFCALADYCENNFEQLYPPRENAKLAALRWLSESRFTSQCPKIEASVDDADGVKRLKDALGKLRPALEKRFSSSGAPFPLLLYKRVTEWEKSIETASSPTQNNTGGSSAVDTGKNEQSAKSPVASEKNNGDVDGGSQDPVVIKLSRNEYQELIGSINKIKTLLTERR